MLTAARAIGYTGRSIQFMVAPMYVAGFVCSIIVAWSSDRFNDRAFHMAGCALVSALGFMIPLITLNNTARYIALVVGISGFVSLVPLWPAYLMSLICNDPLEKRAGAIAFISGFASIGALAGSFIWPTTVSELSVCVSPRPSLILVSRPGRTTISDWLWLLCRVRAVDVFRNDGVPHWVGTRSFTPEPDHQKQGNRRRGAGSRGGQDLMFKK